jgi:hypothetical protein
MSPKGIARGPAMNLSACEALNQDSKRIEYGSSA